MKLKQTPTFGYPGGKAKLAPWIVSMMPRSGRCYCEPFAGRANVYFRAATSGLRFERWWLNDIYTGAERGFLRAIIDVDPADIPFAVSWEEARRIVVAAVEGTDALSSLIDARVSFSGGIRGGGTPGLSRRRVNIFRGDRYRRTVAAARRLLLWTRARITALDWIDCVAEIGDGDFAYLDPPYLGADERNYSVCDVDHAELLRVLHDARFRWLLSGYDSELYRNTLGPPAATRTQAKTMGPRPGRAPRAVECAWRNY